MLEKYGVYVAYMVEICLVEFEDKVSLKVSVDLCLRCMYVWRVWNR